MFTSKIPTSIIAAVAALSILSLGPMTSVASARPKITVQHVEQLCVIETGKGKIYFKEGTRINTQANGSTKVHESECREGEWKKLNQEGTPSQPEKILSGPLPVAGGADG